MNVRCINNDSLHQPEGSSEWINVPNSGDLSIGKIYQVIAVENGFYRIIDDSGEDYLYPTAMFEIIQAEEQFNIRIGRSVFEKISKIAKKEQVSVDDLASKMLEKQLSWFENYYFLVTNLSEFLLNKTARKRAVEQRRARTLLFEGITSSSNQKEQQFP